MFKKIEIWLVFLFILVFAVFTILFGAALRHHYLNGTRLGGFGEFLAQVAALPATANRLFFAPHAHLAVEQRFYGKVGFGFGSNPGERPDLGYILVSKFDGDIARAVVELVDLDAQETIHQWLFETDDFWRTIDIGSELRNPKIDSHTNRFSATHPLLLADGSIVTQDKSPLIKVNKCSNLDWIEASDLYHHSNELDYEGNIWVPSHIEPNTVPIGGRGFYDDAITKLSPAGEVVFQKSIVQILDENSLGHLIYGRGPAGLDPIHLNDIQPVLSDGYLWQRGDVFLSLRNQSLIMLYRPETNEVIWHKLGPWLHQHDVDVIDDHRIAVFNNNARTTNISNWVVENSNNEFVFDFRTGEVYSPFQSAFEKLDIRTPTRGRAEFTGDKTLFVEESDYGRMIHFNLDGEIDWQFVNRARDGLVYRLHWSRLVPRDLGDQVRKIFEEVVCDDS